MSRPPIVRLLLQAMLGVLWTASPALASAAAPDAGPPRLVVLIAIDQFPQQYLVQMQHGFAPGGFFRQTIARGAVFTNCRHEHALTTTGPGHSVMLTGAFPQTTGIIGNTWFDRHGGVVVNCVLDTSSPLVGGSSESAETGRSPRNLFVPTVGDVLKLATANKAKVFGVALKDRAAILTTGHLADGAYWFDSATGNWVTSRYYRQALASYLEAFNAGPAAEAYVGRQWERLYGTEKYRQYRSDDSTYEANDSTLGSAFPHQLAAAAGKNYYDQLKSTPFANDLTLAVARTLVEHEQLGADAVPDLLCVGLSANDYVGHNFGPYSEEVQDMTYRTDTALAEFTAWLDQAIGRQSVIIVTSDHGVGPIPEYAAEIGLPAARNPLGDLKAFRATLEATLRNRLGELPAADQFVEHVSEDQVYLNRQRLSGSNFRVAQEIVRDHLVDHPGVAVSYTREQLLRWTGAEQADAPDSLLGRFALSFSAKRSGDVLFALKPYAIQTKLPASHGTPWQYDRHVVLLLAGPGIRRGTYATPVSPPQIAPTLCELLGIERPPACVAEPLRAALQSSR